ncbi:MAG: HD domain-containing protein [Alphaproteobacteria bacterium]|nr:HD domain-containing protein [Alphaproteobacteria bacterium]
MTFQRIEELARHWQELEIFPALERALDGIGFTDQYVQTMISPGAHPDAPNKSKVIKDNVWGMIELDQSCLRLLDCPILQRMRTIKQLGFSYLTYPSAEHSRFVHSLGMFCVVSRFLETIARLPISEERPGAPFHEWPVVPKTRRLLQHAAILHDVGHLPFSHVVEGIIEADPDLFRCGRISIEEFTFVAERCLHKDLHLAECLSVAIIISPRFVRYYEGWVNQGGDVGSHFRIAAMVAGLPPEEGLQGLSGMISGPSIDADKIDYINRDALACGIPVGVDVARLFLRSAFLKVKREEIQRLTDAINPPPIDQVIFVVNASGLDSIEEIGQARTTLYHRVYLHQTTRNAERLLALAIHLSASAAGSASARFDARDALHLWQQDDVGLLKALIAADDQSVKRLATQVYDRRLPKRAATFGRNYARMSVPVAEIFPKMSPEARKNLAKQIVGTGLDKLRSKQLFGEKQRELEKEIHSEAALIAEKIRNAGESSPGDYPEIVTILPMPNLEPNRSDCIVLENERLSSTAASSTSDEQLEAADIAKSTGYVMTTEAWREIVFVATRSILYRHQLPLSEIAMEPYAGSPSITVKSHGHILLDVEGVARRVGIKVEKIRSVIRAAGETGYFDQYPRLAEVDIGAQQLLAAAIRLRDFNGQGNWSVTAESLRAFVAQVPPRFRQAVFQLIESFSILDRTTLVSSILSVAKALPRPQARRFVVGMSPDSGSEVRIKLEHELRDSLQQEGWAFKKTIRDVLDIANGNDELILCDDNVASGNQALCQFMAWLDVPQKNWTEEQKREQGIERSALSPRDQALLKVLPIRILTALGTPRAKDFLAENLSKLGLTRFAGLSYARELVLDAKDLGSAEEFLRDVGQNLLAYVRYGQNEFARLSPGQKSECENDSLGYSGQRALVCTTTNVPTGTVTAFWCPGMYKGEPWVPLLIRRGYLKNLVLA